jgi:SAM-dependent methyltransferase
MPDWGAGRYELVANDLERVGQRVVAMAGLRRGEKVLDIATGPGNAALHAARLKAEVTGVDVAPRLLDVARERASSEGLDVDFRIGDAQQLPFPAGSFDVVLSIFGIIFADDRERAFSELVRVLKPGGRAFFTAWLPGGAIDQMTGILLEAVGKASGFSPPPPPFEWSDPTAMTAVAARHAVQASFHDGEVTFTGESPDRYFSDTMEHHPMSVAFRPMIEAAGLFADTTARALQALRDGNEDPAAFRATSHYRIVEIRAPAAAHAPGSAD